MRTKADFALLNEADLDALDQFEGSFAHKLANKFERRRLKEAIADAIADAAASAPAPAPAGSPGAAAPEALKDALQHLSEGVFSTDSGAAEGDAAEGAPKGRQRRAKRATPRRQSYAGRSGFMIQRWEAANDDALAAIDSPSSPTGNTMAGMLKKLEEPRQPAVGHAIPVVVSHGDGSPAALERTNSLESMVEQGPRTLLAPAEEAAGAEQAADSAPQLDMAGFVTRNVGPRGQALRRSGELQPALAAGSVTAKPRRAKRQTARRQSFSGRSDAMMKRWEADSSPVPSALRLNPQ